MSSRLRFSFAASLLFLAGCGRDVDPTRLQNPISSGEARFGFQSEGDAAKKDSDRVAALAQTDSLLAEIRETRKLADVAKKSLARARGGLLGISTTQAFGQRPNGFQIGMVNGFLATASQDMKKLGLSLEKLKEHTDSYDGNLKKLRAKSRIVSTLTSEATVALLWGYNSDHRISYFNVMKMYEVERSEQDVERIIQALRDLESQVSRTRESLADPKK